MLLPTIPWLGRGLAFKSETGPGSYLLLGSSRILVEANGEAQDVRQLFELLFACVWVLSLMTEDAAFTPNRSAVGSLALSPLINEDTRLKVFLRNLK